MSHNYNILPHGANIPLHFVTNVPQIWQRIYYFDVLYRDRRQAVGFLFMTPCFETKSTDAASKSATRKESPGQFWWLESQFYIAVIDVILKNAMVAYLRFFFR